jgi:hypothetical protein
MAEPTQPTPPAPPTEKAIPTDAFILADYEIPSVKDGTYTITARQELRYSAVEAPLRTLPASLTFTVGGPQFKLMSDPGGLVHYPDPLVQADLRDTLPYVVMRGAGVPWERGVQPGGAASSSVPWLALLLFHPGELEGATKVEGAPASFARRVSVTAKDLGTPVKDTYVPWADDKLRAELTIPAAEANENVQLLEIEAARFRKLCPSLDELPYLAHVRRVSLKEKVDGDFRANGDFSIVIANRLPVRGENTAVLVSLQGFWNFLKDGSYSSAARVRLVCFSEANHTSRGGEGTFADRAAKLTPGVLSIPVDAKLAGTAAEARLREARLPVAHQPEGKPRTVAWYRGPLVPTREPPRFEAVLESPDDALVTDPDTGVSDISCATAFSLGRMLAISDAAFGPAVRQWSYERQLASLADPPPPAPPVVPASLAEDIELYLRTHATPASQTEAVFGSVCTITEWLSRLLLLYDVPIEYLLPTDRLLPPENIRLFHVDPSWLEALADGALSIGAARLTRYDRGPDGRHREREALRRMTTQYRRLQRNEVLGGAQDLDDPRNRQPISGFVLRSDLLRTFPGVAIELRDKVGKLEDLRHVNLAGDVRIVLVRGIPTEIVIKEPREALRFALHDGKITPRDTDPKSPSFFALSSTTGEHDVDVGAHLRGDGAPPRVIDVARLVTTLSSRPAWSCTGSGARFAAHLLRPPVDRVIPWETA